MGFSLQSLNPFAGLISANSSGQYLNPAVQGSSTTAAKPAAAAPAKAAAPAATPLYWIGTNGHVYLKATGGNTAAVTDLGLQGNVKASQLGNAYEIDDPNKPAAPGNPTGNTGATGPVAADKSLDIGQQEAGLKSVDGYLTSGNAQVDAALAAVMGKYATEDTNEAASTKTNNDQNELNLTKNQQTAYVNAAQGRQGLYATLASLGALNGTGVTLATRAVAKGANDDLSGANDTYNTNSNAIAGADEAYQTADKERKDDANTAAANAKTGVQNNAYKQQLGYYQQLSSDYADQLDSGNASKYASLANALFPQIQATTVADSTPTYAQDAYTAPTLANYLAGNSTQVSATPASGAPGSLPGLVATNVKKKVAAVTAATPALATA